VKNNKSFLALLNKKQNAQIYSLFLSEGHGNYVKYVSFPWPPLETALSIYNLGILVKNNIFFEYELIITKKDNNAKT
jgi:hypothetical protein